MGFHSLDASAPDITLDEILDIKHPGTARWSRDGRHLAWLWNSGDTTSLWACRPGDSCALQVSRDEESVDSFEWGPDGDIAYSQGGDLWLAKPGQDPRRITEGKSGDTEPRWSHDGRLLAFSRKGVLLLWNPGSGTLSGISLPGTVSQGSDGAGIRWSPQSSRLAVTLRCGQQRDLAVVDRTGRLLWRTDTADNECAAFWIDEDRIHYTVQDLFHWKREQRLHSLGTGEDALLAREESEKGMKDEMVPVRRPHHDGVAYVLTPGNWPHLFYLDLASRELRPLTDGDADDTGHAEDLMSFSPDGSKLMFSSNRGTDLNQRRLWAVDMESATLTMLTSDPGTDSCAVWSPDGSRIVFARSGPYHSKELYVMRPDGGGLTRLTRSMPETFNQDKATVPTHVTYPSTDGLQVHADLFLPKGFEPQRRYPAIIFIHGGMSRQMRFGWHPLQGYSIFYSFNQYLLHKGYVILSVDYRGSIGYGKQYEQATHMCMGDKELADVAEGATYLKSLGYVDPDAIGVYGISYGGYLTLGAMTKYAERFALGINIAGIWDWEQYANWNLDTHPGRPWFGGFGRMGGRPGKHNAQAYFNASPRNFVEGLTGPVLTVMGTADVNVDFQQTDRIIEDCVRHGKDFAVSYYPGEVHVFKHRHTWADAFPRMERAFARYLKTPKEDRPVAMI